MAINFADLGVSPARATWKATEKGDYIVGRLTKLEKTSTKWGPKVIMHLDDVTKARSAGAKLEPGNYATWPTPGLLEAMMEAGVTEMGTEIGVKLAELKDTGKPTPFKRFEVRLM